MPSRASLTALAVAALAVVSSADPSPLPITKCGTDRLGVTQV